MANKKANSNCLDGLQCPRCNSLEPLTIGIAATLRFYDDGSDDQLGDTEWDPSSYCQCDKCSFAATIADFTLPPNGRGGSMKLHFPWAPLAKALDEVRMATAVNPLYGKGTGKGLWLVGDHGVEFISLAEVERLSSSPSLGRPESLCIEFTATRMIIRVQWRRATKKGGA